MDNSNTTSKLEKTDADAANTNSDQRKTLKDKMKLEMNIMLV